MSFREQADKAVQDVAAALGTTPTPEQVKAAADMIEQRHLDIGRHADGGLRLVLVERRRR